MSASVSTSGETEAELWHRARLMDDDAFAAVYRLHEARIYGYVFYRLRHHADAEDVLALVFLELWRKRESVHVKDGTVLPWLLVTAENQVRNAWRAQNRHQDALARIRDELGSGPREHEAADVGLVRDDALNGLLRRLKPADAILVVATTVDDSPIHQVAESLGLTAGNARVRLHRALKKLRVDALENDNEEDRHAYRP